MAGEAPNSGGRGFKYKHLLTFKYKHFTYRILTEARIRTRCHEKRYCNTDPNVLNHIELTSNGDCETSENRNREFASAMSYKVQLPVLVVLQAFLRAPNSLKEREHFLIFFPKSSIVSTRGAFSARAPVAACRILLDDHCMSALVFQVDVRPARRLWRVLRLRRRPHRGCRLCLPRLVLRVDMRSAVVQRVRSVHRSRPSKP